MRAGHRVFEAWAPRAQGAPGPRALLRHDSVLRLTGICVVEVDENRAPRGFRVLVRSAAHITVLQEPPWWSAQRILGALGLLAPIFLLTRRCLEAGMDAYVPKPNCPKDLFECIERF